jgi:hypothetical protein
MPNTGNFNPEWGYLAPRPGFMRSFRMALVAGAIGTVSGMAVAVAFIAHPAVDLSVAARTMAQLGESEDLPNNSPNDPLKSVASPARAEMLEINAPPVAASQASARPIAEHRDVKDFAAAESHSVATFQHPAALTALAEAPALSDDRADVPGRMAPALAPKKTTRAAQAANVAALAEAPALRDDASAEMSTKAAPGPSPRMAAKKAQAVRVRTARADLNSRDRDVAGPFDLFRNILGGNSFFNDHQVR